EPCQVGDHGCIGVGHRVVAGGAAARNQGLGLGSGEKQPAIAVVPVVGKQGVGPAFGPIHIGWIGGRLVEVESGPDHVGIAVGGGVMGGAPCAVAVAQAR